MPTQLRSSQKTAAGNEFHNSLLDEKVTEAKVTSSATNSENASDSKATTKSEPTGRSKPRKNRRFSLGKLVSLFLILTSFALIGAGYYVFAAPGGLGGSDNSASNLFSQLGQLGSLLDFNQRTEIRGEKEGRTNALLIGRDAIGGAGLTDTIMLVSYYHKEGKAVTVNIPRDFYVYDGFGSYKINAVYSYAEQRVASGGPSGEQFLADFISKEFNIPIHYWASINFAGLTQVIDTLGGIEVDVPNGFTDCEYPTDNYSGYIRPCPTFQTGKQTMDGRKALIYARSRNGNNGESGDFARGRRQSIVIQSIAQTAKSQGIAGNATKINAYLDILGRNVKHNATLAEILSAAQLGNDFSPETDFLRSVWETGNGFLCPGGTEDGAYIITYCGGAIAGRGGNSQSKLAAQNFVQNLLVETELSSLYQSKVVLLGNQSADTNAAYNELLKSGFTSVRINNAYTQIPRATTSSIETITVYITDPTLRELFTKLDPKPTFEYALESSIPADRVVPQAFSDAQVIIWVS